jgi:ribosomal-protein-alanine N-acetyltransferase
MRTWLAGLFGRAQPVVDAARMRDARRMAELHGASFHRGWGESEVEQLLGERNVLAHCLRARRRVIGFIISRLAADEAEILSVAVDPSWRGRGLSRTLLATHLGHLAGHGIRTVFLEVEENNAPAVRLYRRVGFQTVGRREQYYRDPNGQHLNALVMQRGLS